MLPATFGLNDGGAQTKQSSKSFKEPQWFATMLRVKDSYDSCGHASRADIYQSNLGLFAKAQQEHTNRQVTEQQLGESIEKVTVFDNITELLPMTRDSQRPLCFTNTTSAIKQKSATYLLKHIC